MGPKALMEFQSKSSFCKNTTFKRDFAFTKSCSPIFSEKKRISAERTLPSKNSMVTKGSETVSHFMKFISIVPYMGQEIPK